MLISMRSELLKLRTVRSTWFIVVASQLIVIAGISGLVLTQSDFDSKINVEAALAHVGLTSLCTLVLGIMAVAGEFRNRTITDTYLSYPAREKPLLAKLMTYSLAGLAISVISCVTAIITASIWWSAKDAELDLGATYVWSTLAGSVAWTTLFAAIGVGIGAIVRNLTGAVALSLAWIAMIEGIFGQIIGRSAAQWLPFAAGQAAANGSLPSQAHLEQVPAVAVLLGYVAVAAAVGAFITLRRDVP